MKSKSTLLAGSLLLLSGFVTHASLATPAEPAAETLKTSAHIEAQLKSIRVADFNIERVQFSKALEHLEAVLEPQDLQIIFRPYEGKDPKVNLKTRNLTFSNNLSYLCRQAGYEWWADNGVIVVAPKGSDEALVTELIPINNPTVRRLTYK